MTQRYWVRAMKCQLLVVSLFVTVMKQGANAETVFVCLFDLLYILHHLAATNDYSGWLTLIKVAI